MSRNNFILVFVLFWHFFQSSAQNIPHISCPNYFQYLVYGNKYIGKITIPNLSPGTTILDVKFSQREQTNYYGRLSLYEDDTTTVNNIHNGFPVSYLVEFPYPNILPKLTYIGVNGQTLCSSNGYPPPNTILNLQHKFEETTDVFHNKGPFSANNNQVNDKNFISQVQANNDNSDSLFNFDNFFTNPPIVSFETSSSNPISQSMIWTPGQQQQFSTLPQVMLQRIPNKNLQKKPGIQMTSNNVTSINSATQFQPSKVLQNRIQMTEKCGIEKKGNGLTPFIQFGTILSRGQFPWLTAIYKKQSGGTKFICGGSLVSSRTVLTAAHCFKYINLKADSTVVYLGRHNLESFSEPGVVTREIKELITHPEYDINSFPDADIAILQLESPVEFMPVCIWNESIDLNQIIGQTGYVAGWGADENGNEPSPLPKVVDAKIISENDCRKSSEAFKSVTSPRTLCAGNKDGSGPCMGDSGGGLMINRNGRWVLRGIVSAGQTIQRKCNLQEYVIYCDVAKHLSWVQQHILQ